MPSKFRPRRPALVARSVCRQCERKGTEGNPLSSRLLCRECAVENITEPGLQLQAKSGPHYEQWVRSSAEYYTRLISR